MNTAWYKFAALVEKDGGELGRCMLRQCIAISATAGMQLSDPRSTDTGVEGTCVLHMMLNMANVIMDEIKNVAGQPAGDRQL